MPIRELSAAQLQEGRPKPHSDPCRTSDWHLPDTGGIRVPACLIYGQSRHALAGASPLSRT